MSFYKKSFLDDKRLHNEKKKKKHKTGREHALVIKHYHFKIGANNLTVYLIEYIEKCEAQIIFLC